MNNILRRTKVLRSPRKLLVLTLVTMLVWWTSSTPVRAAAGDLDLSFGSGGKVVTPLFFLRFDLENKAFAVALQNDGKIVSAGSILNDLTGYDFALTRHNPDGSPDTSFGTNGAVMNNFSSFGEQALAVAIQSDGKIVAAGHNTVDFLLARYNSDGTLDPSFGNGGSLITNFLGNSEQLLSIALQPDGKIVAAGFTRNPDFSNDVALVRYNIDGSLDAGFGVGGKVKTDFAGSHDEARSVVIQGDGKIVVGGNAFITGAARDFALARYNVDGSLDPTFGSGGKSVINFGIFDLANDIELQRDGKIVITGSVFNDGTFNDFAVVRCNADGSLDTSFGSGGKATADFGGINDVARSIAIQADGKIVVAGTADAAVDFDFALARFNSNGNIDNSFGSEGKVSTEFVGLNDEAFAVAIQRDGKIIAAGYARMFSTREDFALVRYEGPGFDICIQDESSGDTFQINSSTGDYQFASCSGGAVIGGTGALTQRGCTITLQHISSDRRIIVRVDTCRNSATAAVQVFSPANTFTISDRNTANNRCGCL
jgi:uncharacterized delta-60 repeat protein